MLARRLLGRIEKGQIHWGCLPIEEVCWPHGYIVQSESFRSGRTYRHVTRNIQRSDIVAVPFGHLTLVEKSAYV